MDFHWLTPRSNKVLVPLTAVTLLLTFWVETSLKEVRDPLYAEMLRAAEASARGAHHLKTHRLERGVFVDLVNDPAETALIGQEYTQITTDRGYLDAKLASTDPNFAAVVVDLLRGVGVEAGDCVALAMTGSFPALNVSALAAVDVVGARPVTITSVGASNFGATDPFFTWLDMERELVDRGLLSTPSLAASIGGANDSGRGLSPKGRQLLRDAIDRSGARRIDAANLEDSIRERLGLYREGCGPGPVAAYVNIGGGVASLGHSLNAGLVPTGATLRLPRRNYPQRGALIRLAAEGVPVIHLLNVRQLRDRHGLEPVRDAVPQPGTGAIFGEVRYDLPRAVIATAVILGLLTALFAFDRQTHQLGRRGPEDATP